MSFDTNTRKRLSDFVADCRKLLCGTFDKPGGEITRQLAHYGIQPDGRTFEVSELTHLDQTEKEVARTLRQLLEHKKANTAEMQVWGQYDPAVYDLIQEQGFTVLNRLCALRMAEERGILELPSVSEGMSSSGFESYEGVTGKATSGITKEVRYQHFLFSLFDELSLDLGSLFDRYSPQGLLFPAPSALADLLKELNHPDLAALWGEDETIGWVYQYWNSKDERKAMRDASAAPRNSRELAVRNQFFTPRYVVEFLTDNTLGRIWYEMTKGETRLAEQCRYLVRRPTEIFLGEGEDAPDLPEGDTEETFSQEELLKQPVHIPHRPVKDPREIRLLDPACGSMHFGLYAFDLFEAIYEESWDNGLCPALKSAYPEKADYLRDVPRLIIEHNIHGVDIDPRAVQIAGLSLWLRAQKTWKDTPAAGRPRVRRSNIVCAEPMPGSDAMLEDFVQTLDPPLLRELVKTVFDKMQLAGEAGTLLKIEEEIRTAIDDAKAKWEELGAAERDLFSAEELNQTLRPGTQQELTGVEKALTTDHRPLATDFFDTAEERIYAALRDYAESAEAGDYQRRLFAEDAAHGFAFIDLCRKCYDAVVMNPPFGSPSQSTAHLLSKDSASNIYPAFVLRGAEMSRGFVGVISDRTFVVQGSFEKYRTRLITDLGLISLLELGWGILDDADVAVATYFLRSGPEPIHLFSKMEDSEVEPSSYLGTLLQDQNWTALTKEQIARLPKHAFAHTLPAAFLDHLEGEQTLKGVASLPRGLGSNDANRTYSTWFEKPLEQIGEGRKYRTLANGGPTSPFFRDEASIAEWLRDDGEQLTESGYSETKKAYDQKASADYFKPGLTFPKQSSMFNAAPLPEGAIPTREGKGIVPKAHVDRMALLAYLNSSYARYFVQATNGLHKQSGPVGMTPVPEFDQSSSEEIGSLAQKLWSYLAETYTHDETSRSFRITSTDSDQHYLTDEAIDDFRSTIDRRVLDSIGVSAADQREVEAIDLPELDPFQPTVGDDLQYCLGAAFGRWDIRYATGERQPPELPDPFDPLPVCPPGMLQNADGLPAAPSDVPDDYPLPITWPGILVSDPGHPEDIVARVRDALAVIWGERSAAIEQEACEILGVRTLRDYFAEKKSGGKFFKDHLKRYSKSRRQAPIYWPLSTESGSYTLWIYYHRLTDQSLFGVLNDFVNPKLETVQVMHDNLRGKETRSTDENKQLEQAITDLNELTNFKTQLEELARYWKPNLNDGVQITATPLWKLFRHTSWRNKLKKTWGDMERGKYDWAHLSHSIWPERVIPQCITDRSLAIAHGYEEDLWEEKKNDKGKLVWVAKENALEITQELITKATT